jgi:ureidoglycolate amidohydrolase
VTAIAAPAALRVTLTGEGGHAGVVLMPDRKDALSAAAEIALAVEHAARTNGSADSVATTGVCRVHPGAVNSIPSKVELEIDIRDAEKESRDRMVERIRGSIESTCTKRKIGYTIEVLNADPPAKCDERIVGAIEQSCRAMNIPTKRMVSRAYHDSLFMARVAPTAMIFIPCASGISHRPDEYSSPEEIATGAEVLARTLAQLAA